MHQARELAELAAIAKARPVTPEEDKRLVELETLRQQAAAEDPARVAELERRVAEERAQADGLAEQRAAEELADRVAPPPADDASRLLERNGYNVVRNELLGVVRTLGATPPEAIDAALTFAERATARLRIDPDPRAREALDVAETELELLRYARDVRRRLAHLEERLEARAVVTAR